MKSSIKKLCAVALVMATLSTAAVKVNAAENKTAYTTLTQVKNISKIIVKGNVKLILVQDAKESLEVFDQYYTKNALVQQQGDELRISSFEASPLTVIAHVNNISAIEASDSSSVATAGNFNLLNLNVVLNDRASAQIKANTVDLYTKISGTAKLNLSGTTEGHYAVVGIDSHMKTNDFTAIESSVSVTPDTIQANQSAFDEENLRLDLLAKLQ